MKCPFKAYQALQDNVAKQPQTKLDLQVLNQANYDTSNYREDV